MMNKKGFTLVELISVIIIIALISTISFQIIVKRINDSKIKLRAVQINNIIEASKKYMLEYKDIDKYHTKTICVEIETLQEKGFLEKGNIKDPTTKENFSGKVKIKYDDEKKQYTYNYTDTCVSSSNESIYETLINDSVKLEGNTDGLYETTDSYVYKGENPNNYISFNNRIWRIVSIDKETMMAKIVNLNSNQYTINENITIIDSINNDFITGSTYPDEVKKYINTNSKWNKGIIDEIDSAISIKSQEKQSVDYKTIGLLTVGDIIDASLDKNCFDSNSCNSYLNQGKFWLLNKQNNENYWYVDGIGLNNKKPISTDLFNVYHSLYLNLSTSVNNGDGTEENPYTLK